MSEKQARKIKILSVLQSAIANVQKHMNEINDLNVFPIPDGDTGSNMTATLLSGWENISSKSETFVDIMKDFTLGAFNGARGNSGVILSQIIKGAETEIIKHSVDWFVYNKQSFSFILKSMMVYAYKSVNNPVEGTILTVTKKLYENWNKESKNLLSAFKNTASIALSATNETTNELQVLQEAGVVDSGAFGLVKFINGLILGMENKPLFIISNKTDTDKKSDESTKKKIKNANPLENIGYCTEFILSLKNLNEFKKANFKKFLNKNGDSLVYIINKNILKVHIHTKEPGIVINEAHKYGQFTSLKSDNMALQAIQQGHEVKDGKIILTKLMGKDKNKEEVAEKINEKELGIIAVSNGIGLNKHFSQNGVDNIIFGGQTMNPSVKQFIDLINKTNYKYILLLPNNKNIILTANMAAKKISNKKVFVYPTKTIGEGMITLYNLSKDWIDFNDHKVELDKGLSNWEDLAITKAIRHAKVNAMQIKKGDFLTIQSGDIISINKKLIDAYTNSIEKFILYKKLTFINVIYNTDVKLEDLQKIVERFPDVEFEFIYGGQELYPLIIFGEK